MDVCNSIALYYKKNKRKQRSCHLWAYNLAWAPATFIHQHLFINVRPLLTAHGRWTKPPPTTPTAPPGSSTALSRLSPHRDALTTRRQRGGRKPHHRPLCRPHRATGPLPGVSPLPSAAPLPPPSPSHPSGPRGWGTGGRRRGRLTPRRRFPPRRPPPPPPFWGRSRAPSASDWRRRRNGEGGAPRASMGAMLWCGVGSNVLLRHTQPRCHSPRHPVGAW